MASEWRMKMSLRVKKYLKVTSFLSSAMTGLAVCSHGRRMLTPKAVGRPGAFVSGLHDARPGAGDDHETGLHDFAPEVRGLLIDKFIGLRARRAEDGDLAFAGVGREEAERVAQFAQRGLDDAHVAGVAHVGQEFQGVFDDVGDFGFVVAAAFEADQFLDARLQFGVDGGFFAVPFVHNGRITARRTKARSRNSVLNHNSARNLNRRWFPITIKIKICTLTIGAEKPDCAPILNSRNARFRWKGSELR